MSDFFDDQSFDEAADVDVAAGCCCCDLGIELAEPADVEPYADPYADPYVDPYAGSYVEPAAVAVGGYDLDPEVVVVAPPAAPTPAPVTETVTVGGYDLFPEVVVVEPPAAPTPAPVTETVTIGGYDLYPEVVVVEPPVALAPTGSETVVIGGAPPFEIDPALGGITGTEWDAMSDEQKIASFMGISVEELQGSRAALERSNQDLGNRVVNDMITQEALRGAMAAQWGAQNAASPLYNAGDDLDPSSPFYSLNNPFR